MKKWMLVVAAVVLGGSWCGAVERGLELGISQGYAIAVGGPRQEAGDSYAVEGSLQYRFLDWLSAGLELGYWPGASFQAAASDGKTVLTSDMKTDIFHAGPVVRISSNRPVFLGLKPYVEAAGGAYWSHRSAGTLNTPNGETGVTIGAPRVIAIAIQDPNTPMASGQEWDPGYSAGIGVTGDITEHLSLALDLRYHRVLLGLDGVPDLHYLIPALRLSYGF